MGKSAILVVPVTVVLVFVIICFTIWLGSRPEKKVKKLEQNAELADDAMSIFKQLLFIGDIDGDIDILSERSKTKIKSWAEKYRKVNS